MKKHLLAILALAFLCLPASAQTVKNNSSVTFGSSGSGGASLPANDNTPLIQGNLDVTKLAYFSISGNTTGTTRVYTMFDQNGTIACLTCTQSFTNKTLTSSTNVLGGVTLTLGSDATGDTYYRSSGGVLTRLAVGTDGQVLTLASGLPSWATPSGGGGSGTPAGSGSEIQYRVNGTTFGAISGTSVVTSTITHTGRFNLSPASGSTTPLVINLPSGTTSDALVVQLNGNQFAAFTQRSTLNLVARNGTASEANGDIWQSNDYKTMAYHLFGRDFLLPAVLYTTANSLNTSSASETGIVGSTGINNRTVSANYPHIGQAICVDGDGYYSTTGSPATLTINVKLGSTTIGTTGAVTPSASVTNGRLKVHACFPVRAAGVGGTVQLQGEIELLDGAGGLKTFGLVNTSAVAVDLSVDQTLDVLATWGSAIGGQSVTLTSWRYTVAN